MFFSFFETSKLRFNQHKYIHHGLILILSSLTIVGRCNLATTDTGDGHHQSNHNHHGHVNIQPHLPVVTYKSLSQWVDNSSPPTASSVEKLVEKNMTQYLKDLNLADSFGKISAFAVVSEHLDRSSAYSTAVENLMETDRVLSCISEDVDMSGWVNHKLDNGYVRYTYGTSTSNFPLCLDTRGLDIHSISRQFDDVEVLVSRMIERVVGRQITVRNANEEESSLPYLPHKDHLHIYEPISNYETTSSNSSSPYLVPTHVDNGMFLILTPFPSHSLRVTLSDSSTIVDTRHLEPRNTVVVLMGAALTDWLLFDEADSELSAQRNLFYASPHHVKLRETGGAHHHEQQRIRRSVFARMKVAEMDAKSSGGVMFKQFFMNFEHDNSSRSSKFEDAQMKMCKEGEDFCWMSCMTLPQLKQCAKYACKSTVNGVTCGGLSPPMDASCKWECEEEKEAEEEETEKRSATVNLHDHVMSDSPSSSPHSHAQPPPQHQHGHSNGNHVHASNYAGGKVDSEDPYCTGKMDMLMNGFESRLSSTASKSPCIILLIEAWTLDSPLKFYTACLGIILLGVFVEFLVSLRRKTCERFKSYSYLTTNKPHLTSDGASGGRTSRQYCLMSQNQNLAVSEGGGGDVTSGGVGVAHPGGIMPQGDEPINNILPPFCRSARGVQIAKGAIQLTLHALNILLAYLLMLAAMTYSVEILCSVVIGLTLGHAFFNLSNSSMTSTVESSDPCCISNATEGGVDICGGYAHGGQGDLDSNSRIKLLCNCQCSTITTSVGRQPPCIISSSDEATSKSRNTQCHNKSVEERGNTSSSYHVTLSPSPSEERL